MRDRALTEDRDRIARDLHDSVIQRLFAIGLSLQGTARLVERPEAVMRIGEAIDKLDETIRQLRKAIFDIELTINKEGLHPKVLDLVHELRPVLGIHPQVSFSGPVDKVVTGALAEEVLAVLREALTNVGKHANASQVVVTVAAGDELRLVVADDGNGIGDVSSAGGLGLRNMRQRAERRGGGMDIGTSREGGTRLSWHVPLDDGRGGASAQPHRPEPSAPRAPATAAVVASESGPGQPWGVTGRRKGFEHDDDGGDVRPARPAAECPTRSGGGSSTSTRTRCPASGYLAIVVLTTIMLYYLYYVEGAVTPLLLPYYHMSFQFFLYLLVVSNAIGAFSAFIGGLSDKIGRANLTIYGTLLVALIQLFAIPHITDKCWFAASYCVIGFVEGVILVSTPALMRDFSPQMGRGVAMGFWALGPTMGALAASLVATHTLDHLAPWQDQFIISGLVCLGVVVIRSSSSASSRRSCATS